MKTYFLDTINRIQRFSHRLDVVTTLSNKTWVVFNDSGERELYIFQTDGTVIITNNGIGVQGQWQWIEANKSLIIHRDGSVIMLHPQYIDNEILALNLDGTNKTAFLIEEDRLATFTPRTLTQLKQYFNDKEQRLIAAERQKDIEMERIRIEQEREEEEKRLRGEAISMLFEWQTKIERTYSYKWLGISLIVSIILSSMNVIINPLKIQVVIGQIFVVFFPCMLISIIALLIQRPFNKRKRHEKLNEIINNWIEENPNDPINRYLSPETGGLQGF